MNKIIIKAILFLAVLFLVVIFTVQNAGHVNIKFFALNLEASLSLVIFLVFLIGITIGLLLFLPSILKKETQPEKSEITADNNSRKQWTQQ